MVQWQNYVVVNCFCSTFRALYFATYSKSKEIMNNIFEPDSTQVHMTSAGVAGKDFWILALISWKAINGMAAVINEP